MRLPLVYPAPTPEQFAAITSETGRYRHLTAPFCVGAGVDIASQGDAVVPWAMSFDLPEYEFAKYSNNAPAKGPIHLRGFADELPFVSESLDFVYSSHLLEDFYDWLPLLGEWTRVCRIGGYVIILVPDKERWQAAVANGQPPNCSHHHEAYVGELTSYFQRYYGHFQVIRDSLADVVPGDYTIIFVARRLL